MAAAEARAAWQRTANRCFVQEDAKRAPKLASCSSSSSKPQCDASNGDAWNGPDHAPAGFMPLNWNPTNSSLPPDTKWWLQLQPNYVCPKDFSYEQLNILDAECEGTKDGDLIPSNKLNGDPPPGEDAKVDPEENPCPSLDFHWRLSAARMKHDSETRVKELKAVNSNLPHPLKHKADIGEYWCADKEFMDWNQVNQLISDEKACFNLEMPWMEGEKTEPWWRTADKDELASLVAQKSLEHVENCDLPRPQTMNARRGPFTCFESFGHDVVFSSSLDGNVPAAFCNEVDNMQHSPLGSADGKKWPSTEALHSFYGVDKPSSGTNSIGTTVVDLIENGHITEDAASKAQLLEALRHSQTRAREAEKAAKQACNEKEHVIKLFFRQASHLFAYKQWLQLLQLETLLLQLKGKDHQKIYTLLPSLPWMPLTARQFRKGVHKVIRRKGSHKKCSISKYAVAVAVGLGLAGAGLLLGWTMGWLLPAF